MKDLYIVFVVSDFQYHDFCEVHRIRNAQTSFFHLKIDFKKFRNITDNPGHCVHSFVHFGSHIFLTKVATGHYSAHQVFEQCLAPTISSCGVESGDYSWKVSVLDCE